MGELGLCGLGLGCKDLGHEDKKSQAARVRSYLDGNLRRQAAVAVLQTLPGGRALAYLLPTVLC